MEFNKQFILDKLKEVLDIEALKKEVSDLKDVKIFHYPKELLDIFILVVKATEKIARMAEDVTAHGEKGKIKRDAVVSFLDGLISFGWFSPLEAIDGPVIGAVVDTIVPFLNGYDDWD